MKASPHAENLQSDQVTFDAPEFAIHTSERVEAAGMIKEWRVKNFKSLAEPNILKLAKINVIAGANSSGKSSVIQSILLLKQTLQYAARSRALALNGPILRLGDLDDVKYRASSDPFIEFGFKIEFGEHERINQFASRSTTLEGFAYRGSPWRHLDLSLTFADSLSGGYLDANTEEQNSRRSRPLLISAAIDLKAQPGQHEQGHSFVRLSRRLSNDSSIQPTILNQFEATVDSASYNEITADKPDPRIVGGAVQHFLPTWTIIQFDIAKQLVTKVADYVTSRQSNTLLGGATGSDVTDYSLPKSAIDTINKWLLDKQLVGLTPQDEGVTAKQAREVLQRHFRPRGLLSSINSNDHAQEAALLREQLLSSMLHDLQPNTNIEIEQPRTLRNAAEYIRDFFTQGVRYLGPLRDAPRAVYPVEALENPTDVGYRGEHTAAVLETNAGSIISYHLPPPEDMDFDYMASAESGHAPLRNAVTEWLKYLGVAVEVRAVDTGVFGNELRVSTDAEGAMHHLTNVGVGVSQVLPIVVNALLAQPGALLIFEQPELHLHPKVQARLADFFVALALDGKQLVLETHSEYLIDRLRLRIALAEDDDARDMISILFSEKRGGKTTFTPVELTEYGAVTNWPKDFFEQSQRDVGRILKAASSKRRSRAEGKT
ncbi:DUF3696 domain-containing protein [Rhizobium leguminosarum]|uniref:AAA family ATPase n=1 Tax=Rhizobium leguminosarum TaxID=384 RepID=UPI003F97E73A